MKHAYFASLLKRYLHDDCTQGEAWTVDQWYEARDMPRPAPATPAEQAATKARVWQQIQARTQPRPAAWRTPQFRWAAAALLALGLSLGGRALSPRRLALAPTVATIAPPTVRIQAAGSWLTCTNPTAQTAPLTLNDGSTVLLRPHSRLRYPQRFDGAERVVTLQGEAFFQVFHDANRPFRVLTDKIETVVLGTSFTVRAFPDQPDATVMVRTGRVRVRPRPNSHGPATRPGPDLVLRPNQQVVYSPQLRELRPELIDEPALLQAQPLTFDERPVAEVLATLQVGYGVPIRYDGATLAPCTVSLGFVPAQSLFDKLDLLCRTLGASYERADETIIFRSRGCQTE